VQPERRTEAHLREIPHALATGAGLNALDRLTEGEEMIAEGNTTYDRILSCSQTANGTAKMS
jgi:hypothetical protein